MVLVFLLLVSGWVAKVADARDKDGAPPRNVGYRRVDFTYTVASGEKRTRQLDLWYPTLEKERRHNYRGQVGFAAEGAAVAPGPHPLVLFSHGFLGASDQTIFLTEAMARAGYVVAAMNHADALSNRGPRNREPPRFAEFAKWTEGKYRDRREDLVALLDQLLTWNKADKSAWQGRIDKDAIGALGHSLGGYTVLGMAGGWKSWKEPRLKTLVLLSPFAQPFSANGRLQDVRIPVMLQGGTLDWGITPFLLPVYLKLEGPKVFLTLKNETHFGWTNLISLGKTTTEAIADGNAELMTRYTLAFFDQHLREIDRQDVLEAREPRLEAYRIEGR